MVLKHSVPPRSVAELNQCLTELALQSDHPTQGRALRKNLAALVIAQLLPDNAYLKGGSAISLRYSLEESRLSRDVDSVYRGSKERFLTRFRLNLAEGWHGFTGVVVEEERKRTPEGVHLTATFVTLFYRGGRFAKVSLEASPELIGDAVHTEHVLDGEMRQLYTALGFPVEDARVLGIDEQLAEKLNGATNPEYPRGRDLRDIEVIMQHHRPNLEALRSHVRASERQECGHAVAMIIDRSVEDYRNGYREAGGTTLEHAWGLTQRLLQQVDVAHQDEWQAQWQ